jgi:hypothetical protein
MHEFSKQVADPSIGFFLTWNFPVILLLKYGKCRQVSFSTQTTVCSWRTGLKQAKKSKRNAESEYDRREFIEEIGILFEDTGHPRMAGRIFGLLLVAEQPMLSSAEITEELQASKASVSTMTRLLLQSGLIERVARPGDRKDYFRMKSWSFDLVMERQLALIPVFRKLLEKGRPMVPPANRPGRESLEQMIDFYNWLEQEIPALKERWNRRKV